MWARTLLGRLADVSCLSALASLQTLNLYGTQVEGDISNLSALTSLRYLDLRFTQVQADVGCLNSLASLQKRGLLDTQVTGDIGSQGARKVLGMLATPAMMTGDISRMLALKNLQGLDQAARGVVAQGLEHASLPAILLMKSAAVA